MGGFKVADVRVAEPDSTGALVLTIHARYDEVYAVCSTRERVSIQFADKDSLAADQRRTIAPLSSLRAEINGLIDGWRSDPRHQGKTARYDRSVGAALALALESDIEGAQTRLGDIKATILAERTSRARLFYLVWAAGMVALLALFSGIVTSRPFIRAFDIAYDRVALDLWLATAAGALGAFFSISVAISDRSVKPDLQMTQNVLDAVLRITIGAIAGLIFVALLRTGVVGLSIGGRDILSPNSDSVLANWPGTLIVAFAAGFSERLVRDLLQTATATRPSAPAQTPHAPPAGAKKIGETNDPQAPKRGPDGSGGDDPDGGGGGAARDGAADGAKAGSPDLEQSVDCVHGDAGDVPATPDERLPAASGGVAS